MNETLFCKKCDATGMNKKGEACSRCQGTGIIYWVDPINQ